MRKKVLDELYAVCIIFFVCVASILWSYNMTYVLCVVVVFMMQKLTHMSVNVQPSTNVDDEFSEKVVLGGVSTKGRCSAAHTQNETTVPSNNLLRKLVCFIMDVK